MKKILLLIAALFSVSLLFAQSSIKGTVTDAKHEPLVGVSVVIKGTSVGTSTDINGSYQIKAKNGDVLVFQFLGMVDKEVQIQQQGNINVVMLENVNNLDDVVVIGYGEAKKSDLTGAVATVKPEGLKNSKIGMVSGALQGMVSGVQVTQGNMKPGADASIVIRGAGSINAGTSPLYIIDGVPGSLQDVSQVDIQSIEILKDASSASIYGSRGSNGVVLITTKRGEAGKNKVTFNVQAGIQQMMNKQDLMNAQQYYDLVQKSAQDYTWTAEELRLLSRGESTDWQDAVTQLGDFQNYNLSVSSGNSGITNYFGVDYYDQDGIVKNSSFDRITIRDNVDSKINDWVKTGMRFNVVESKLRNINEESDSGYGTMFSAISAQPTAPIYDSDGNYFDGFLNTKANPVAIVDLLDKTISRTKMVASFYFELEPIKNLVFKTENSGELVFNRDNEYEDPRMGQHYSQDGHALTSNDKNRFWQSENTLTYNLKGDSYKLSIMGGFSASKNEYQSTTAQVKGISSVLRYNNLNAASSFGPDYSYASASTLASTYLRATYDYSDRYLATLTFRADGSSRFAPGHRWGFFPSMAFAWRISEEDFLKNSSWVSNLKLRMSLGRLGNQNIGDYAYEALVSEGGYYNNYVFNGNQATGAVYSTISNTNLTWEKANQLDLGLDFGLFKNRVSGTIEGYYKRTTDLLWEVPLPYESGYLNSYTNIGKLDNAGIEFTLNTINLNKADFQWTTSFNFTYNHNEIKELYDGKQDVDKTLFVGHSLYEYYTLISDGIWQSNEASEASIYNCQPGDRKVVDRTNDNVINGDDRTFRGQSVPTWYGGITNAFYLKNFDLKVLATYAGGYKINNSLLRYLNSYNTWGNMSEAYYDNYWTEDRPSNVYPAPRIGSPYSNGDGTDANLQDGKYLRIKNVELGYSVPNRLLNAIHISGARVFVSIQNLYTLTAFTGFDVESSDDTNPYPGARSYIGGFSINF
ncbi:MAG: TonB-dependent receptor [Bacteroidales bacterium]|nr:TonB-dependent receptor [Bacteroidales bacterium]MCI2144956.1 TonB-dependent receptor [Bacteroidales bacterium]